MRYDNDGCGYEHPGDAIAQPVPPDYPAEFTRDQRLTAYWYAQSHQITVDGINGWYGVLAAAERIAERRRQKVAQLIQNPDDPEEPF
jgi:hypothetical protein